MILGSPLKPNSRKKGTLIITGLLRNLLGLAALCCFLLDYDPVVLSIVNKCDDVMVTAHAASQMQFVQSVWSLQPMPIGCGSHTDKEYTKDYSLLAVGLRRPCP